MSKNNTPMSEWEYQYQREYNRIIQAINRQKKLGYFVPEEVRPLKPSQKKTITPEDVERLIEITPQKIRKSSIYIDKETGEGFKGLDVVNSHHKPKPSEAKIRQPSTNNGEIQTTNQPKQIAPKQPKQIAPKQTKEKTKLSPKQSSEPFTPPEPSTPPKENTLNTQIVDTINRMLSEWQPAPYWHASFLERKTENYYKISAIWQETLETDGEYEVAYRIESNATELIRLLERLLYSSDSTIEDDFNIGRFIELLIGRALTAFESDAYSELAREAAMDSLRGENSFG